MAKTKRTCEGKVLLDPSAPPPPPGGFGRYVSCGRPAVTFRKNWRLGNAAKGEPTIVNLRTALCASCARLWDDAEAEVRWEASVS